MQQKVEGGICPQCNIGKIVKSPKTGKLFCENKCWLTPQPQQGQEATIQVDQEPKQKVDWEAKERLSAAQTALNATAQLYQGKGDDIAGDKIELTFKKNYSLLRSAKKGMMDTPEVDVSDIPFN